MIKEYSDLTLEEKRVDLFLRQKRTLDLFLERNAISKAHFVSFEKYGGTIPNSWIKATIGDVVSVSRGASPRPIQNMLD